MSHEGLLSVRKETVDNILINTGLLSVSRKMENFGRITRFWPLTELNSSQLTALLSKRLQQQKMQK